MNLNNSFSSGKLVLAFTLALSTLFSPLTQAQLFHGGAIFKTPLAPDGTDRAHTGDVIRAIITVTNSDDFGDNLTITSIIDTIHHSAAGGGDMITPNLLPSPVILGSSAFPFFTTNPFSVTVTNLYRVLPGDEKLPSGVLQDDARADGFDNHDGVIGPTFIRQSFFLIFPGQITVLTNITTNCVLIQGQNLCAVGAFSDPTYRPASKPPGRNQAFWLRGISTNLVFYPQPGSWTEDLINGTAQLSGTLRSLTNLSSGFNVTMNLSGRQNTPPPGSPNKEAAPNLYLENGGPIDASLWHYYTNFTGTLNGFGFWQGALVSFRRGPTNTAFQVGFGANGKNTNFGATGWFLWTVVQQPASGTIAAQTTEANINLDLFCCAPATIGDFVWNDLNGNGIQDVGEPGVPNAVVELLDCTNKTVLATTTTDTGGIYHFGNLLPGSYIVQFVPPAGYHFTSAHQGGDTTRDSDADPVTGLSQCVSLSSNEINLTIDAGLISNCVPACVIGAFSDPTYRPSTKPPDRNQAIWMKGISTNLVFSTNAPGPGHWVENSNGTAQMTGTVFSQTNMTSGFTFTLNLSGRTTTVGSGSPKLDLDPSAYVQNGGPLDPSTWYYYPTATGTLTGFGFWQGAVLTVTRFGPAFQVGVGASGKNQNYGASAWFTWTITQQPASGALPTTGQTDVTVDLICCP